jgi:hypothetical protein
MSPHLSVRPILLVNLWGFMICVDHRGRFDAPKGPGGEVTSFDELDNNPRYPTPPHWQGTNPSRGNGFQRGSSRWDGNTTPDLLGPKEPARKRHLELKERRGNASLSQLLYEDRPLLKPVTFVRSRHTPTLFLEEEEIFKPVAEEAGRRTRHPTKCY